MTKNKVQPDDPSLSIGQIVKDFYGRELGRCIGYTVDMAGKLSSIGVEAGAVFIEYPGEWIASLKTDEITVMPEWKVDAKRFGLDKGILEKRVNALSEMMTRGEISRKVFDEMSQGLEGVRETHDNLSQRLVLRLEELEGTDDRVDTFLARVKLQGVSEEIDEAAVKRISEYCANIKSMNADERVDIEDVLELVNKESLRIGREEVEEVQVEAEQTEEAITPPDLSPEEEKVEEAVADSPASFGSLRSLGGS